MIISEKLVESTSSSEIEISKSTKNKNSFSKAKTKFQGTLIQLANEDSLECMEYAEKKNEDL